MQRGRSFNWADLPPPGQDENRPTFARWKGGSGTGSRLDAESLGATFERARLAGLCSGGAPLALEDVGKGEIRRILKVGTRCAGALGKVDRASLSSWVVYIRFLHCCPLFFEIT